MPRPKTDPYKYRRPGKWGFYAFLDHGRKHISLKTDDETEAGLRLAELVHDRLAEGNAPKKGELGRVILTCAERAQVNHTSKYAYDLNLKLTRIATWLDGRGITDPAKVNLAVVEQFKSDLRADGLTDRSINRYLDSFMKAMKLAIDEGVAPRRAIAAFRKLKEPQHRPNQRGLTMDELDAFMCAVDDERDYWHFRAVSGSGIRDDESRHLEPDSIRGRILVIAPLPAGLCECHPRGWTTKNHRYREIPVSNETADAARSFAAVKHSMNLEAKSVWRRLQAASEAAEIDWQWSMHDLRRAWGSHLLGAGQKLSDVSRWFGHQDILTTMRYLRVIDEHVPEPDDLPL